jgi:hypothetical protein
MGISSPSTREIPFTNIFQCHASPPQIKTIRDRILLLADQCKNRRGMNKDFPHITDMAISLSAQYISDFNSVLYSGLPFKRRKKLTIADELTWKWTELTGKFVGCQFWSLGAARLFNDELKNKYNNPSLEDGWTLAGRLDDRRGPDGRRRPDDQIITHEHVFPIKFFRGILSAPERAREINELRQLFSRFAIGCVVLQSEHPSNCPYDRDNPWRRYRDKGITLAENPNWPDEHKDLIRLAELQAVPA